MASSFTHRVLAAVRRIPRGHVATYGDIAALAGSPRAWRAVGTIMRENRDPATPCHRVIAAGGGLGGYGGNLQLKRELLRAEGLEVGMTRVRDFSRVRWQPRRTTLTIPNAQLPIPNHSQLQLPKACGTVGHSANRDAHSAFADSDLQSRTWGLALGVVGRWELGVGSSATNHSWRWAVCAHCGSFDPFGAAAATRRHNRPV